MKIGDQVLVHGYVDEIRKDVVIIRNDGGYFGTVPDEIISGGSQLIERKPSSETIFKIMDCIVEVGRNDEKFKWGGKIRYTPSEILNILKTHEFEIFNTQ